MSPALLLAPHPDDETLFAFYTLLRDDAHVFVLTDPIPSRQYEFEAAMKVAGRSWTYSRVYEGNVDWEVIRRGIENVAEDYSTIIAPAYIENGHEQHNETALIAATLGKPVTWYHTYVRGESRTTAGIAIFPSGAEMELKRRAMGCYVSQMEDPLTAPWFRSDWGIEYVELPR